MLECSLMPEKGSLFVVATPIGNMSDITLRAIEVLKDVDLILSEDTRETAKLLHKFELEKQQISYRDQNHQKVLPKILNLLDTGTDLALVSDSGTPVISDPGFKLVSTLAEKGYKIVPVPGASALTAALSISGLPTDNFSFLGFLPKKTAQREQLLKAYGGLASTIILYESPFRIRKLLAEINTTLGNRYICFCRELTKIHEEIVRGFSQNLEPDKLKEKGEYVVLIAKENYEPRT